MTENGSSEAHRVVHSDLLPAEHGADGPWVKLGFRFGEEVDGIYVRCTLPEGWTKTMGTNPLYPSILDRNGRERVGMYVEVTPDRRRANAVILDPQAYVLRALFQKHDELIVDEWTTPEVLAYALDAIAARARRDKEKYGAADFVCRYCDAKTCGCMSDRLAEADEELARIAVWNAQLGRPGLAPATPERVEVAVAEPSEDQRAATCCAEKAPGVWCDAPARFEIQAMNTGEPYADYTMTCEEHVGHMLGSITDRTPTHWEVTAR